jgi:dolichol-phosphate mannosyltransferase
MAISGSSIAVVIPCYRVIAQIGDVIAHMPPSIDHIICVDDGCPDGSGAHIEKNIGDPRVTVIRHQTNQGVGAAMVTGFREALRTDATIVVKIDGDGQMDPALIPRFVGPIIHGEADVTKGNRFFRSDYLHDMPWVRVLGNAVLSFMAKLSSGYWNVFDPNNGYIAIHADILRIMPLDLLSPRYFFESDFLFRLNLERAVVLDIPMKAVYGNEVSGLSVRKAIRPFLVGNLRNTVKRILYRYFLHDFNIATVQIVLGTLLMLFGGIYGLIEWHSGALADKPATAGTVMLAGLPIILGFQLLLSALNFDIASVPDRVVHRLISKDRDI